MIYAFCFRHRNHSHDDRSDQRHCHAASRVAVLAGADVLSAPVAKALLGKWYCQMTAPSPPAE
jgi:hypothetical protein